MARGMNLNKLSDVRRMLAKVANMLLKGEIEVDKARGLGYLGSVLKDCIKESDLEVKFLDLEEKLMKMIEEKKR